MKTKKWLLLALCLLLALAFVPATARAEEYSGQCGDSLYWSFDESTGTLTITGSGDMYDYVDEYDSYGYECESIFPPWEAMGYEIKSITLPNGLTSIGGEAFCGCTGLTSITIPNSVTSIGNSAFYGCTGLTSVTIPNGVTSIGYSTFSGCTGLTSITIPNGVTRIGFAAFSHCTGLTSVTIPNSVTSIGGNAFSHCTGLTSITIPNSVTSIDNDAFSWCTGLTSITIPNSVTSIGDAAFSGCTGLTSVTIPNSVTSIGYKPFAYCWKLTNATIGANIRSCTFEECTGLTSVTFGNSVTSIASGAFKGCTGLISIHVDNGNKTYCSIDGVLFSADKKIISLYPIGRKGSYSIPNGVTSIGSGAFDDCTGLTNVTIGNSVTSIGGYAFSGCTELTSVTIPNSVTYIGWDAFSGCTGLKTVQYAGTKAEKEQISIEDGNDNLLNAIWQCAINVTFNANGGSGAPDNQLKTYGVSIQLRDETPKRTGYTFLGWATTADATQAEYAPGETYSVELDITLYAVWEVNTYTITLNPNSGSVSPTTQTVTYGEAYGTLPTPTRTGYTFAGWWTTKDSGGKKVTASTVCYASGNYTLYARWTAKTYTVTLNPNGGSVTPTTKAVTYGQAYGTLPTPTRSGYTFDGWWTTKDTGGKKVTVTTVCYASGNYTLYARWKAGKTYTVTLNPNGGSCGTASKQVTYGKAYGTLPVPTRKGYTFAGWWTAKTGGKKVTASTICYASSNYTLYARWTEGYTMTFDPNGGTVSPTTKVVKYGQAYGTLPTPTRAGYTFTGWWTAKTGGKQVKADTVCYASAGYTLYARWTAKKFVVTLNPNGGECATKTKTVTYGQAYGTMPVPSPRTGYTFSGWYTAKTGGKKVTATTVCYATGNYIVYARWTPKTYTVTLNPNGGTCTTKTKTVTYGQTYGTLPVPTRDGYVFAGWWTTQSTGGKRVYSTTTCYATGNYTLYARWWVN